MVRAPFLMAVADHPRAANEGMTCKLHITPFQEPDRHAVVSLWRRCGLVTPQNDPDHDIDTKTRYQPELFFVGSMDGRVDATAMAGYEGHRG